MTTIAVDRLTKRYGATTAVDDLSFTVPAGSVTGFIGPNGAGKTTTLRALLGLVGLADAVRRGSRSTSRMPAGGYSLGMRRRLALAAALLGDPPVLVLDEPANGLDPWGMRWLRDLLRGHAARGATVLVSSHVLAEVALIADRVEVVDHGRLLAAGPVGELTARGQTLEDAFLRLTEEAR